MHTIQNRFRSNPLGGIGRAMDKFRYSNRQELIRRQKVSRIHIKSSREANRKVQTISKPQPTSHLIKRRSRKFLQETHWVSHGGSKSTGKKKGKRQEKWQTSTKKPLRVFRHTRVKRELLTVYLSSVGMRILMITWIYVRTSVH